MTGPTVYRSPLYYDVAYGWDVSEELKLIEGCLRRFGGVASPKSLYEPGSGTGRLAIGFAKKGFTVRGLDASGEMNAYASARAEAAGVSGRVRFELGLMEEVPPGEPADGAYCALSTFRYLASEASVVSHLSSLGRRMRAGAVYVLDTRLAEAIPRTPTREWWEMSRGEIHVVNRWTFEPPEGGAGIGSESLSMEVNDAGRTFTLTETSASRLDTRESFEALVARSGAFEVAAYLSPARDPNKTVPPERAEGRLVIVLRRT